MRKLGMSRNIFKITSEYISVGGDRQSTSEEENNIEKEFNISTKL